MKYWFRASALVALAVPLGLLEGQTPAARPTAILADPHRALINTYCVTCHNARLKTGGLALDGLNLEAVSNDAQIWEKALRKMRGRLMPPPGAPQPSQKDMDSFAAWMENTLDSGALNTQTHDTQTHDTQTKTQRAGYVPIQRMNRTEYAAAIKSLVGVEVNAKDVLPQDIQVEGFDNIAAALTVSPAFVDQYIAAARQVAHLAVGSPNPRVGNVKYSVAANQNPDVPLPLGTRGGIRFKHNFPADGEYQITLNNLSVAPYTGPMENQSTVVILIDDKIVFRKPIGGPVDQAIEDRKGAPGRAMIMERFAKIPVQVQAGQRDVVVAFIDRSHVESDENISKPNAFNGLTGSFAQASGRVPGLVDGVVVVGPFHPQGISKTPSRSLIFVCNPVPKEEPSCARQITENLARRAYRRPVTSEDTERLMPFYEAGRENGGNFDQGIEQVVAAVLASPDFLYRGIRGPKGTVPGTEFALTDLELASRLSFFLWNTGPDQELLTIASTGGLTKPGASGVMEKQVRRMLADAKASSLVTSFAMKWLNLTSLDQVVPDPKLFPNFNDQLRRDFYNEAEAFVSSILLDDRPVVNLLSANHTFLNERLARYYGISGVVGPQLRRVTLSEKERFGLLGKGAVLLRTSYGDRTSPVLRGAWVLDKLLGTPPTPPPPDTATDLSQKAGEAPKTVRARLEEHRNKASCRMCHGVIDPTGLALENFDATGQWRTHDRQANAAIDASTVLPNGVPINGVVELRTQLAARPALFAETVTERLMIYALNRQLEYFDMPQVRAIVRSAAKDDYKFSSLILGIVNSDAFRKQGPAPAASPAKVVAAR